MNTEKHYLSSLFEPNSIAIIGASDTKASVGATVATNILAAGYAGKLFFVNPKHKKVQGLVAFASIDKIPQRFDLAVVCASASETPDIVDACGQAGCRNVLVMSPGFTESGAKGASLQRKTMETARRHGMRLLGPNFPAILRPSHKLNLAYVHSGALPGSIGLISQSGAFAAAFLDWARLNKIGFSNIVSLGAESDVDFGEVLDYMATDPLTESIFLYIEDIKNARRFMSALRAAARCKPVLLIKVGRHGVSRRAVSEHAELPHSSFPLGADDVFDAALRRAGVVRLSNVGQMFAAAAALFSNFRPRGNRLAIISNGGGPGVMAADYATHIGIPMAQLTKKTITQLNATFPENWSAANPTDVLGDADPARYGAALQACLDDEQVDGVLALFTPLVSGDASQTAQAVIDIAKTSDKPVITCWMGGEQVRDARQRFESSQVPSFHTPEPAIDLFSHISHYYLNRQLLVQTPSSVSETEPPRLESARLIIEAALLEGRKFLNQMESKAVLSAFMIRIAPTVIARSATEAMVLAEEIGLPVVMKVVAPSIERKSEVGGVKLGVGTMAAVREVWQEITESVKKFTPQAQIEGIAIEPMIQKTHGRDLYVGIVRDKVFGPTIVFGPGGSDAEVAEHERAVALPPLNAVLVADLLASTRGSTRLGEYRNMPPVNRQALEAILLRVSEMVCELPWITAMSINPLIIDEVDAVAVDARISIQNLSLTANHYDHMAIHPYPSQLTTNFQGQDGTTVTLRPIKPEDAQIEQDFIKALPADARYMRFMNSMHELSPAQLMRMTQIDYHREMAFVAVVVVDTVEVCVGDVRYATNPDGESCDFAIVVAESWQGKGLARRLMGALIDAARGRGLKYMSGDYLAENTRMLAFVSHLGFVISPHPEDPGLKRGVLVLG